MPTLPTMPTLDLSAFDLSKIQLPKVQLPTLKLPKVALPKVQLPAMPTMPTLANLPVVRFEHEAVAIARDAAYASIGLGVLAVQQAQRGVAAVSGQLRRYAK